jgi:hypothetical protein
LAVYGRESPEACPYLAMGKKKKLRKLKMLEKAAKYLRSKRVRETWTFEEIEGGMMVLMKILRQ